MSAVITGQFWIETKNPPNKTSNIDCKKPNKECLLYYW